MKTTLKTFLLLIFIWLSPKPTTAQVNWDWAAGGGGTNGVSNDNFPDNETVRGITADDQGNIYFVANTQTNATSFGNQSYTTYSATSSNGQDIYVASVDANGNFRWDKVIGSGSANDFASGIYHYNGSIFVGGTVFNTNQTPLNFDTDFGYPAGNNSTDAGPHHQRIFLVKYDSQGAYQYLLQPTRDNVTSNDARETQSFDFHIDSGGTIHWMMRPGSGTHTEMNFTDPGNTEFGSVVIARFDQAGSFLGLTELNVDENPNNNPSVFSFESFNMIYDEALNRYIISMHSDDPGDFSLDGTFNTGTMMLAAIDLQGQIQWRIENNNVGGDIFDIAIDDQSDIYITGSCFYGFGFGPDSFAGYTFDQVDGTGSPGGNAPFTMRLNSAGGLVWGTNKDNDGSRDGRDIQIIGDEVITCHTFTGIDAWDGQTISHPVTGRDPAIIKYDRATGAVNDIWAIESSGGRNEVTAMVHAPTGELVVGGYFESSSLFTGSSQPTIAKNGGPGDFFIAKTVTTLSLPTASQQGISLYPNPVGDHLQITGLEATATYRLLDLNGRELSTGSLDPDSSIHMQSYTSGVYLLEISTPQGRMMEKVVKR